MSKPKPKRTQTSVAAPVPQTGPNVPLLALSALGIALTGYLSWVAFSGGTAQGCSAGGGCDVVLSSQWARLFGLPTAFWGLLAYIGLAAVAFVQRAERQWSLAWTIALFGFCYSVYLTTVSVTILGAACPYCLTSLVLMTAVLALVIKQRPPLVARRSWVRLIAGRAALAALLILVVHGSYVMPQAEPSGPEDPMTRALAEHLADEGALFYGAAWCEHCRMQKAIFGSSASRLPYIECSPGGPNSPQSPSCSRAGVRNYPTWVIGGRTIAGQVLSLAQLAEASAFPDAANFTR